MLLELKMIMVEGMPKYLYHCETCEERFLAHHLMSEKLELRDGCDKTCLLKRLPLFPINLNKNKKEKKVGEVVKQHIKDTKEEVKEEKERLKNMEYKP